MKFYYLSNEAIMIIQKKGVSVNLWQLPADQVIVVEKVYIFQSY